MNTDMPPMADAAAAPSADYINAISRFFDTDPQDLLVELGYYERNDVPASLTQDASASQE